MFYKSKIFAGVDNQDHQQEISDFTPRDRAAGFWTGEKLEAGPAILVMLVLAALLWSGLAWLLHVSGIF